MNISNSTRIQGPNVDKRKEGDRKESVYKNVLTFPEGMEHLRYFEKNPHPDMLPAELRPFAEMALKANLNVNSFQQRLDFNMVKNFLEPRLSDKDRKLLYLPDRIQQMLEESRDANRIKALTHLRDSFMNYFSTPLDENIRPDIQWVDYPFAVNDSYVQEALKDLRDNLFNKMGRNKLAEKLEEAGAFGDKEINFYFWNTSPYNWSKISYQARSVNWYKFPFIQVFTEGQLTPQYMALGDFTINAIPEGTVKPKGNGKYDICVNKMYFFINDSFNFEGFAYLGSWQINQENKYPWLNSSTDFTPLYNSDFREYQRHGYGRYFPVLSRLHQVEDFDPVCLEYPYAD